MTLALRQIRHTPLRMDGNGAPTVADGYYLWEPTAPYDDGTGRVERIPLQVTIDGASVIKDIPVTPGDFSWTWKVTGHLRGQATDTLEYVRVPAGTYATVLDFEDLVRVDPATLGPITSVTSAIELRIQALEATPPGSAAGVSSWKGRTGAVVPVVADPTDITATGILLAKAADAAAVRTIASAAAASHTHPVGDLTATGTRDATTVLWGDNRWAVPPTGGSGGTPAWSAITGKPAFLADDVVSIADVPGLQAALDTKLTSPTLTGLYAMLKYVQDDVNAARPTVPAGTAITWMLHGDVPPVNIRRDLGDDWVSIFT